MDAWSDPAAVDWFLDDAQVWAIVGLSGDPWRSAYSVAAELQHRGKTIVPIHPKAATEELIVLGEKGYATLAEVPFPIDVVDVFRRSDAAGEFADQAIAAGAAGVWFQMGVIDDEAFGRVRAAGLRMVMDDCPSHQWHARGRRG
ncbi:CoA-binding protein [Nocardioides baekrokdamisoli]|nr:CoA-binding protein [Nocardioides baekrokdamisoli]